MSEIKKAPEETAEDTLPAVPTQLTGIAFAKAAVLNRGRGGSLNRRTLRTGALAQGLKCAKEKNTPE